MITSIWNTPEVESWCRDFGYDDYTARHKAMGVIAGKLSPVGYAALCQVFEDEMERSFRDAKVQ